MSDLSSFRDDSGEVRFSGYIGSGVATSGHVLTADGNGGSTWSPVTGGGAITTVESTDSSVTVSGGTGPTVNLAVANSPAVGGITVTGTPAIGNALIATSTSAAHWATPAAGALVLLSSTVLGSNANFDISGISGAYNDLILVMIARGSGSNSGADALIRFNNDSGANYQYNYVGGGGGTSSPTAQTSIDMSAVWADASYTADRWGAGEMVVLGYANTARTKTLNWHVHGSGPASTNYRGGGNWLSDAAITRVQFLPASGTWITGSELRIYGRL
jgi:hypothetical protein